MSFAAQLAARAEATTKRTSSGGSSIGSPPQSQSISPSLSESIKNRVSASSTTEQSTTNKQPSTTSGWKPKQQNQNKQKKKKNKKKLVPISPEASLIDSSYRDVEIRHINTNNKKHQPQDVTNNNNSNNSVSASTTTTTTKSSMIPSTATEEDSKRMSFGSAIKAADKISGSSRKNSKEDDDEAVKQSQSISQIEQSNTTTAYQKKLSSSSSEQRLSNTTSALDKELNLSIENITLQNTLQDLSTKYKALELQLVESERLKEENEVLRRRQSVESINNKGGGIEQQIVNVQTCTSHQLKDESLTTTQNKNLVYARKSSDAMSSIGGSSGWANNAQQTNHQTDVVVAIPTSTNPNNNEGKSERGRGVAGGRGEGQLQRETSGISVESFVTHDELMEENVRLTQLILDIGRLEELEKLRRSGGEDNITQQQPGSDKAKATIQQLQRELTRVNKNSTYTVADSEKDNIVRRLEKKLAEVELELKDITELKNAEIAVLRKQLNRAENIVHNAIHKVDEAPSSWSKEREGLRDEIRRLNVELSNLKGELQRANSADEEELADLAKYNQVNNNNSGDTASPSSSRKDELDSTDVTSLQSIIEMMRQTIEQNTREKKVLEERLEEEQARSQMELQAFAKTLEGVDDLRQSAESMSREIRRIKVKGYRPTRSDLFGNANTLEGGGSNFGELTAAVEASDNMEAAIRLIENQNDKMEERRRMNLVVASTNAAEEKKEKKYYPGGLSPIKDDDGDGFLSFWNRGDENEDDIAAAKKEKKRKSKKKKKHTGGGSVLTSFF